MASKNELEAAKRERDIIEIRTKAKIAAWNQYISFGTSKVAGLTAIVCGGLDVLNPNVIPHIPHPEYLLGGGFALLTGKSMVSFFSKILKGLN